jgi:hypothetical protein
MAAIVAKLVIEANILCWIFIDYFPPSQNTEDSSLTGHRLRDKTGIETTGKMKNDTDNIGEQQQGTYPCKPAKHPLIGM